MRKNERIKKIGRYTMLRPKGVAPIVRHIFGALFVIFYINLALSITYKTIFYRLFGYQFRIKKKVTE
jgi:hypothetical protein